jgi:hypothetical protein
MALQSSEPPNGSASANDVVARKPIAKACAALPDMRQSQQGAGRQKAMAEAAFSAAERALDNQRIGALQVGVVAICTLIQM